tara:strand:+ start:413 stop:1108 length:696 start_codon:yes stop_codon:yes gene_type:complete
MRSFFPLGACACVFTALAGSAIAQPSCDDVMRGGDAGYEDFFCDAKESEKKESEQKLEQARIDDLRIELMRVSDPKALHNQQTREYMITFGNQGRGGAVVRSPDYIHSLTTASAVGYGPNAYHVPDWVKEELARRDAAAKLESKRNAESTVDNGQVTGSADVDAKSAESVKGAGKSANSNDDALMTAWERYCNAGEGMTDKDWELVFKSIGRNENPNNHIPSKFKDCFPPK